MLKTIFTTMAFVGATTAAHAAVIDFETNSAGDVISEVTLGGITVDVSSTGGPLHAPMVFDSDNVTGHDDDLEAPFFADLTGTRPYNGVPVPGTAELNPGNILIISEDGDSSDPDDNGSGGTITFDFSEAITFQGFDVFDDVTNFSVSGSGEDGDFSLAGINLDFDRQFASFAGLGWTGITSLTFDFGNASGAIDNIAFDITPVPVPAGLPLLLAGLGAFGIAARRKKAAK